MKTKTVKREHYAGFVHDPGTGHGDDRSWFRCWCGWDVMHPELASSQRAKRRHDKLVSEIEVRYTWADYRRHRALERHQWRADNLPWVVHFDLAYEGGGSEFDSYYRTYIGARVGRRWTLLGSYGGSALLSRNPARPA